MPPLDFVGLFPQVGKPRLSIGWTFVTPFIFTCGHFSFVQDFHPSFYQVNQIMRMLFYIICLQLYISITQPLPPTFLNESYNIIYAYIFATLWFQSFIVVYFNISQDFIFHIQSFCAFRIPLMVNIKFSSFPFEGIYICLLLVMILIQIE